MGGQGACLQVTHPQFIFYINSIFFAVQFDYFCLENSLIPVFMPAELDFQFRDSVTFHQVLRCLFEVVVQFILYVLSIFFSKTEKIKYVAFHRRWQMDVTLMWKAAGSSAIMVNPPYSSDVSKSLYCSKRAKKQCLTSITGFSAHLLFLSAHVNLTA